VTHRSNDNGSMGIKTARLKDCRSTDILLDWTSLGVSGEHKRYILQLPNCLSSTI
jgi:hypothetical protein